LKKNFLYGFASYLMNLITNAKHALLPPFGGGGAAFAIGSPELAGWDISKSWHLNPYSIFCIYIIGF